LQTRGAKTWIHQNTSLLTFFKQLNVQVVKMEVLQIRNHEKETRERGGQGWLWLALIF
jgi:hypothetical protein